MKVIMLKKNTLKSRFNSSLKVGDKVTVIGYCGRIKHYMTINSNAVVVLVDDEDKTVFISSDDGRYRQWVSISDLQKGSRTGPPYTKTRTCGLFIRWILKYKNLINLFKKTKKWEREQIFM